jgi:hypothetical protein
MYPICSDTKKGTRGTLHLEGVVSVIGIVLKAVIVHAEGIPVHRVHLIPPFTAPDARREYTGIAPTLTEFFQYCSALSRGID